MLAVLSDESAPCLSTDSGELQQQQVDQLKQQLETEPLETPAPKNQPVEEKPAGFSAEDPQRDLIAEMKLNHELSCELDALEGGRLVLMDKNFLNIIAP